MIIFSGLIFIGIFSVICVIKYVKKNRIWNYIFKIKLQIFGDYFKINKNKKKKTTKNVFSSFHFLNSSCHFRLLLLVTLLLLSLLLHHFKRVRSILSNSFWLVNGIFASRNVLFCSLVVEFSVAIRARY